MSSSKSPLDRDLARRMLVTAYDEAVLGLSEGGIPIGAALYLRDGTLINSGHNRRVQGRDASVHAETDAFRKGGRRRRVQERDASVHAETDAFRKGGRRRD